MSILGYDRSTATDFFYTEDEIDFGAGPVPVNAMGGWPFDHGLSELVVMEVGDLISVTVNLWARTGDPAVHIGKYVTGVFVDQTASWTALNPHRFGDFYSRTWWRPVDADMIAYGFVDVPLEQGPLDYDEGGTDGGEVQVVGWRGPTSLRDIYEVQSAGATVHTPGANLEGVNFYVGGGGLADEGTNVVPSIVGDYQGFAQALDDNSVGAPTFQEEFFGMSLFWATLDTMPHWETPASNTALLVGIGPPFGVVNVGDTISGVVR